MLFAVLSFDLFQPATLRKQEVIWRELLKKLDESGKMANYRSRLICQLKNQVIRNSHQSLTLKIYTTVQKGAKAGRYAMSTFSKTVLTTVILVVLLSSTCIPFVAADAGFTDYFSDSTLYSSWTFVNPAGGGTYSRTYNPGWLRITSPPGYDLGGTNDFGPRIMQQVQPNAQPAAGDFDLFTKVTGDFSGTEGKHAGRLLAYIDDTHFMMRVERRQGQTVQIGGKNGAGFVYTQFTPPSNYNPTYLTPKE